jgi:hypothetical protein
MKRLLKDREWLKYMADAARLQDCKLDPQSAFTAITGVDQYFNVDNLVKDSGAGVNAYWGAISDDAKYVCEAYIYDGPKHERKVAFVAAPVDDLNSMRVCTRTVERASEIKGMVRSGITFNDGSKLIFSQEYTSLETAKAAQPPEENTDNQNDTSQNPSKNQPQSTPVAASKKGIKRLIRKE